MKRIFCICLAMLLILGTVPLTALAVDVEPAAFRTEPMVAARSATNDEGMASNGHSIALASDGTVWEWGNLNLRGWPDALNSTVPVQVQNLNNIIKVVAGGIDSLALRNDGTVWSWGSGELPTQVPTLNNVIAIAINHTMAIALRSDGTVWEWEYDSRWDENTDVYVRVRIDPAQVQNLHNVIAIASRVEGMIWYNIALRDDGTIWEWGRVWGQPIELTQVQALNNVTAIAAEGETTIALRGDGTVWTWYWDWDAGEVTVPEQVQNLNNITAIAPFTALRSDGTVWVWYLDWEEVNGDWNRFLSPPAQVQGLSNVIAIASGVHHSLAVRSDGTVWAWGLNWFGQLGDGTVEEWGGYRFTPVQVLGPGGVGFLNLGTGEQQQPDPPTRFTDVPSAAWFHDAVAFVYDEGIMRGASETAFDPMADFNREQVVATLFRMYHDRPANASDPTATPFADVRAEQWYAPYIAWAFEQGIVTGQTETRFGTGDPVTRQDFAVLAHRLANLMGADIGVPSGFTLQFTDAATIGTWAQDAMTWAVYAGLFTGTDEGLLNPWNTAVRAEAATILMRYTQTVAE